MSAPAALLLCAVLTGSGTAEEKTRDAEASPPLRYHLRTDGLVTAGLASLWIGSEAFKGDLAPKTCRWCDRDSDGSDGLNGLDASARRALLWSDTHAAGTASDVSAYVLAPAAAFGLGAIAASHDSRLGEMPANALLVLEAAAASAVLTQAFKLSFGRQRPYAHFAPGVPGSSREANLSFYSGHTSFAFSLVASSATIASMRGYRRARWVWRAGLVAATATAYLRVAADSHYLTDVVAGAVAGTAVGIAVPRLVHGPPGQKGGPALAPGLASGAPSLTLVWTW